MVAGRPVRLFVGFLLLLFVDDVGRGDSVLAVSFFSFGLREGERERERVKASRRVTHLK